MNSAMSTTYIVLHYTYKRFDCHKSQTKNINIVVMVYIFIYDE